MWTQCRFFGEKKKALSHLSSAFESRRFTFTKVFLNWSREIILQGSGSRGRLLYKGGKFWIFPNRVDACVIAIDCSGNQLINFRRIWINYLSRSLLHNLIRAISWIMFPSGWFQTIFVQFLSPFAGTSKSGHPLAWCLRTSTSWTCHIACFSHCLA